MMDGSAVKENRADRTRVFFGPGSSVWKCLFMDVVESPDWEYCEFRDVLNTRMRQILFSPKLRAVMPHCVRRKLYRRVLGYRFLTLPRSSDIFFGFTNGFEMFGDPYFIDFIRFLKKEFPNAKLALHYYETLLLCYPDQLPFMKENFDCILTFDHYSAEKHDIEYYGPVCECGTISPEGEGESSDVLYIGGVSKPQFKRVEFVGRVFRYLADNGKKCIFSLYNAKDADKQTIIDLLGEDNVTREDGHLVYRGSKFYFEYFFYPRSLSFIEKTRVLLEVVPKGLISCTSRLAQAVNMNKKLLTTSDTCTQERFYHPNDFSSFSEPEDIDLSFFDTPYQPIAEDMTALTMLAYMEQQADKGQRS